MDEYISASEIGEYLYCQRAWWLRQQGVVTSKPEVLAEGAHRHKELITQVQQVQRASAYGRGLLWAGLALLILFVLIKLLV